MKNLEQIRAANALIVAGETTKADVNKLPAMIIANGLLATAAFANEKSDKGKPKRPGMQSVVNGLARHLSGPQIDVVPRAENADQLIKLLSAKEDSQANSIRLQRATAEALAFISYVKRFATKEQPEAEV
jgi:CRISPR/Cas system CMR-associated protein Cmr5 small subunit